MESETEYVQSSLAIQCLIANRDYKKSFGKLVVKSFPFQRSLIPEPHDEEQILINTSLLCDKLSTSSFITVLSLVDSSLDFVGFELLCRVGLTSNSTLLELNISQNKLGPESASALSQVIRANRHLKNIFAHSNRFCGLWIRRGSVQGDVDVSGIRDLLQAISESTTLTLVDLHSNALGGYPSVCEFCETVEDYVTEVIRRNSSLKYLNLMYNNLNSIFDSISRSSSIVSVCGITDNRTMFRLPWPRLTDSEMLCIRRELHKQSTLVTLDFSNSTYANIILLVQSLNDFTSIRRLIVPNIKVQQTNAVSVPKALARVLSHRTCRLTHLDMSDNEGWTNVGVEMVARAMEANRSVVELRMGNCGGDVQLATTLSQSLRVNKTLTSLDLQRNNIKCAGASLLAVTLAGNTSLRSLNLSDNRISQAGVAQLAHLLYTNATLEELFLDKNTLSNADETTGLGEFSFRSAVLQAFAEMECSLVEDAAWRPARPSFTLSLQRNSLQADSALYLLSLSSRLTPKATMMVDLNLSHCNSNGEVVNVLSAALTRGRVPLRRLCLATTRMRPESCQVLCLGIAGSRTLQVLDLSDNNIGVHYVPAGLDAVVHPEHAFSTVSLLFIAIAENPNLVEVNLRNNSLFGIEVRNALVFSPNSLQAVCVLLSPPSTPGAEPRALVSLDLLRNPLPLLSQSPDDYQRASDILDSLLALMRRQPLPKSLCGLANGQLQPTVDLRQSGVSPLWAKVIGAELPRNHHLRAVDLSNNPIGEKGMVFLAAGIASSFSLRIFLVDNTDLAEDSIAIIENAKRIAFGQRVGLRYLFEDDSGRMDMARRFRGVGPCKALLECLWGEWISFESYRKYM